MKRRTIAALIAMLACESRRLESSAPSASAPPAASASASSPVEPPSQPKTVRFAWRPPGGDEAAYEMGDPEDQHRLVVIGRREAGPYPVLVALHGQPKRGQSPRTYAFPERVIDVATHLVARKEVAPFVLALPVFRFGGLNWPGFDLAAFRAKVEEVMSAEGLVAKEFYVVGHSGAAGCGGDGMNRAHRMHPSAVGFFDTCLGAGWRDEIRTLERSRIPVWIFQSVETAGVQPRHLREYDGRFDFGQVFRTVDLSPSACPPRVPDAPLRPQPYRCAADPAGLARAFIVDTGEGDEAHNALVSVAASYFVREYLR